MIEIKHLKLIILKETGYPHLAQESTEMRSLNQKTARQRNFTFADHFFSLRAGGPASHWRICISGHVQTRLLATWDSCCQKVPQRFPASRHGFLSDKQCFLQNFPKLHGKKKFNQICKLTGKRYIFFCVLAGFPINLDLNFKLNQLVVNCSDQFLKSILTFIAN